MKRVPDGDELEVVVGVDVLRTSRDPANVVDTAPSGFRTSEFDRLGFLIDSPDLDEVRREAEGDLPGSAREVQQPARARRPRVREQVVEQRLGIGESELVVEA